MYKESFHYMGTKIKLLSQIYPYFPKNIHTFYDVFGGSGIVSMNMNAKKFVLNDLNNHVFNLYNLFKTKSSDEIISYCYKMRDEYGFTKDETDKKKIAELNKEPFNKCRDDINNNPSTLGYYFLTFYSFYNQFRFSNGGGRTKFNMPVGNGYFKKESEQRIKDMCDFFSKNELVLSHKSYDEIDLSGFDKENDFIYLDPPYSANANSVYNEKRDMEGWGEEQDKKFFAWCKELNEKGYKFAMSNVFCNKGYEAKYLQEWCKENDMTVHHLNMKYAGHSRESANSLVDEVLICNYGEEDKDLFEL